MIDLIWLRSFCNLSENEFAFLVYILATILIDPVETDRYRACFKYRLVLLRGGWRSQRGLYYGKPHLYPVTTGRQQCNPLPSDATPHAALALLNLPAEQSARVFSDRRSKHLVHLTERTKESPNATKQENTNNGEEEEGGRRGEGLKKKKKSSVLSRYKVMIDYSWQQGCRVGRAFTGTALCPEFDMGVITR